MHRCTTHGFTRGETAAAVRLGGVEELTGHRHIGGRERLKHSGAHGGQAAQSNALRGQLFLAHHAPPATGDEGFQRGAIAGAEHRDILGSAGVEYGSGRRANRIKIKIGDNAERLLNQRLNFRRKRGPLGKGEGFGNC